VIAVRAPGRVNLIGDHTDYNEGFVLPLAIDLETVVRARPGDDAEIRLHSETDGWRPYAAAVAGVLAERGRTAVGIEGTLSSSVPVGAGLSSSAALEVSLALALCAAAGFELPPLELALACQEAELVATGVDLLASSTPGATRVTVRLGVPVVHRFAPAGRTGDLI